MHFDLSLGANGNHNLGANQRHWQNVRLLETQGSICSTEEVRAEDFMPLVENAASGNAKLSIGNNSLDGHLKKLSNPILLMEKTESGDEYRVVSVFEDKLHFSTRPLYHIENKKPKKDNQQE